MPQEEDQVDYSDSDIEYTWTSLESWEADMEMRKKESATRTRGLTPAPTSVAKPAKPTKHNPPTFRPLSTSRVVKKPQISKKMSYGNNLYKLHRALQRAVNSPSGRTVKGTVAEDATGEIEGRDASRGQEADKNKDAVSDPIADATPALSSDAVTMLVDAVRMASSVRISTDIFTFPAEDLSCDIAAERDLGSTNKVLKFFLDRIEDGSHPVYNSEQWNTDAKIMIKQLAVQHDQSSRYSPRTDITQPAIRCVEPLADFKFRPVESWGSLSTDEAAFRSELWRQMIKTPSYIRHEGTLFFILLCAPKQNLMKRVQSLYHIDDEWYHNAVRYCLETYRILQGLDPSRVEEVFAELTAKFHLHDIEY
ncbi:hypothetical protein N0V90_009975 [Kalmusia sp. IMI 367209]|nr:hypothetical protein N0V90_009975 [Kalmusia sp. IMI 367209]